MGETVRRNQKRPPRAGVRPVVFSAIVIAGFGLFRGVNSNTYLSAFAQVKAPFLFVPDLFFNVVVALSVILCSAVVVFLALSGRLKPLSMPFVLPTVLLIAGNFAAFAGAVLCLPADVALLIPGLLYGAGSVMLSLFWIEVFAVEKPAVIVTQIALAMLLNVVVSSALSPLSGDEQMRLSCVLLALMALCAWFVRRQLVAGVSFESVPPDEARARESVLPGEPCEQEGASALEGRAGLAGNRWDVYRSAFLELGDSLVAFFVLEAVIGLLNSFMLAGSIDFEGSGTVSMAAIVGAIIVFCFVVFVTHRMPKVSTVSRVIMPILAAMLVFLPFLSERYNLLFTTLLLGSYYFVAVLITYLIAEVAHVRRVSPYVLMGVAMGVARIFLVVALLVGYAAAVAGGGPSDDNEHVMRYLVIIVIVLYALCMALVFFSRDRKRRRAPMPGENAPDLPEEAVSQANKDPLSLAEASIAVEPREDEVTNERGLDARCAVVAQEGGLTEREAEVLLYLARGRTKAYIADALFVSENTVRSHVRNIYSKLGVHTRQQLLDLVE